MLAARTKKITAKRLTDPMIEDGQILARLVCYTSKLVRRWMENLSMNKNARIFLGSFMRGKGRINCYGSCSTIVRR